jgi:hypothetical protein
MKLSKEHYIGEGVHRVAYVHPENPGLCIKIPKPGTKRPEAKIAREIKYIKLFQDKLPFIPAYVGTQDTDFGFGYVFEMVRDYNGDISKSLNDTLSESKLDGLEEKIAAMYASLLEHRAPLSDFNSSNLLVQMIDENSYELQIIDGFGNSDFIKICDYSRYFLKKKLVRKFTGLCKKIDISPSFLC